MCGSSMSKKVIAVLDIGVFITKEPFLYTCTFHINHYIVVVA